MTDRATTPQTSFDAFSAKEPALRLLENPGNRGKGYSVRHGMLQRPRPVRTVQRR